MRQHQSNAAAERPYLEVLPQVADEATWEIRPTTGEHVLSDRSRDLLGLTDDEPVSIQRLVAAVVPEDRDRWKDAMERLLDAEGPDEIRVDFRSTASPERWLVAVGRAVFEGLTPVRVVGTLWESAPKLRKERVLLGSLCQDVVEEAEEDWPQRPIHFERWDDTPGIWDGDRLEEVLRSLIWSAVIHSAPTAPIMVSVVDCGDQALMIVAFLGDPLPEHIREHLMNPQHHDFEPSTYPVLCRSLEIIRAHGGRLELSDEYDSTVFHVWLPKGLERAEPFRVAS